MKKHLPLILLAIASLSIPAAAQTSFEKLDINNVKAGFNAGGDLFWDFQNAQFEAPKGSGANTIFTGNLWIGSIDAGGQLHVAAQTYRQTGRDFFQGPISNAYSTAYDLQWDKVWKINKSTIDSFRLWTASPSMYPGYSIPSIITGWPAHGNTANGEAHDLAPYVDANQDGNYDPQDGDYPCIKGDQAIYFLFNDQRNTHTETGGTPFGIEVHGMAYAFNAPADTALNNVIFINYKIVNRSGSDYINAYLGMWTDFDIGDYQDDFIGADVMRNAYYGYNGDAMDGTGGNGTYGANPPAQGVVFLKGPLANPGDGIDNDRDGIIDEAGETCGLSKFMAYNNNFTLTGNPQAASGFYNYLSGMWLDSLPLQYGGDGYNSPGPAADVMYPGASDPNGMATGGNPQAAWDEYSSGNTPGDRRGLGSSGPFTLVAGEILCVDYAFVFAKASSGGNLASINTLQSRIDTINSTYNSSGLNSCSCTSTPLAVSEMANAATIGIYPNPATDRLFIDLEHVSDASNYVVTDIVGRIVSQGRLEPNVLNSISMEGISKGTYIIKISGDHEIYTRRISKQ